MEVLAAVSLVENEARRASSPDLIHDQPARSNGSIVRPQQGPHQAMARQQKASSPPNQ